MFREFWITGKGDVVKVLIHNYLVNILWMYYKIDWINTTVCIVNSMIIAVPGLMSGYDRQRVVDNLQKKCHNLYILTIFEFIY